MGVLVACEDESTNSDALSGALTKAVPENISKNSPEIDSIKEVEVKAEDDEQPIQIVRMKPRTTNRR